MWSNILADAIRSALDHVGIRLTRHDETRLIRQAVFLLDAWGYRTRHPDHDVSLRSP